jgi:hypothetical protein
VTESLPPPLIVRTEEANLLGDEVETAIVTAGGDTQRANAFGALLGRMRSARGHASPHLELFAPIEPLQEPPLNPEGRIWVPHLFCWQSSDTPALAWELVPIADLETLVNATVDDVARWARRPELLLRLARLAPREHAGREHLSFRWLMANQEHAAMALAAETVAIEHVSLHVDGAEMDSVVRLLTAAVGLVEIPRPAISIPGRWLQSENCRVHLNSRDAHPDEIDFPAPAPNHICFAVADLGAAEQALAAYGVAIEEAGSLVRRQVWFRLPGGCVVELQPKS